MTLDDEQISFDSVLAQAVAASQAGQGELALQLFEQASRLAPHAGMPHFMIGSELAAAGRNEAAEQAFARAVLLAPDFPLARYQLGLLQLAGQRPASAMLTWQPLLQLPPTDALGHFVRGFEAFVQDRFQDALQAFSAGMACGYGNPSVITDVRQVIERIELAMGLSRGTSQEPGGLGHVLLAGYSRGLH